VARAAQKSAQKSEKRGQRTEAELQPASPAMLHIVSGGEGAFTPCLVMPSGFGVAGRGAMRVRVARCQVVFPKPLREVASAGVHYEAKEYVLGGNKSKDMLCARGIVTSYSECKKKREMSHCYML